MAIWTSDARHRNREANCRLNLCCEPLTQADNALLVEDGLLLKLGQGFRVKYGWLHRPSARLTWANA